MIDRALLAHRLGRNDVQRVFSHAAQGLLEAALPEIATSFSKAASRQGQGDVIATGMIPHLTPRSAAAVCVVWMMRGARSPAIRALRGAFGGAPIFNDTIKTLCWRAFEPTVAKVPSAVVASPNEKGEDDSAEEDDDDAEAERRYSLMRVFSPFKVIRRVEHVSGDVSFDCAFIDSKGRYICIVASSDEFLSTDLLKKLTKKGFKVYRPRGAVRLLHSICNDMEAEVPTVRVVPRQGVQPSGSIVIDGLVLGRDSDLTINRQMMRRFCTRGSHAEWVTNVSVPALNSQTIVFTISHTFAALLKYAAGLPDAVFNLLGPSSKGKTMALYASASTMGPRKDMITTWLATGAGFQDLAISRQGWSWIIDEARIGLGDKFEENIIFALLNGRTKSKAVGHGGEGVDRPRHATRPSPSRS